MIRGQWAVDVVDIIMKDVLDLRDFWFCVCVVCF